jgi:hypothetical protein
LASPFHFFSFNPRIGLFPRVPRHVRLMAPMPEGVNQSKRRRPLFIESLVLRQLASLSISLTGRVWPLAMCLGRRLGHDALLLRFDSLRPLLVVLADHQRNRNLDGRLEQLGCASRPLD